MGRNDGSSLPAMATMAASLMVYWPSVRTVASAVSRILRGTATSSSCRTLEQHVLHYFTAPFSCDGAQVQGREHEDERGGHRVCRERPPLPGACDCLLDREVGGHEHREGDREAEEHAALTGPNLSKGGHA